MAGPTGFSDGFSSAFGSVQAEAVAGSGGPTRPYSAVRGDGDVFGGTDTPAFFDFDGTGSSLEVGLGVRSAILVDSIWHLRFQLPFVLPEGQFTLRLWALAKAITGTARVNPRWGTVAEEENPALEVLVNEGTFDLTWAMANEGVYHELKIPLLLSVPVAGNHIVMALIFRQNLWELCQDSFWIPTLIWE